MLLPVTVFLQDFQLKKGLKKAKKSEPEKYGKFKTKKKSIKLKHD